jgi:hypothetical protein
LVTPVPLSPLLLLCCAYGGGSIKILLQAMPYKMDRNNLFVLTANSRDIVIINYSDDFSIFSKKKNQKSESVLRRIPL